MVVTLTTGEDLEIVVPRLRLGVGWDKERNAGAIGSGAPDVDLDATALQFTGDQLFDVAFYNSLATRDGSVVHLGDNQTGRGEGDDEAITVDLTRVHPPVDTILLLVSSYQGHSLTWVHHAYCRLVDDATDVEMARFTLSGGPDETGLLLAKLSRSAESAVDGLDGGVGWRLLAVGAGVPITVPTQGIAKLKPFL